MPRFIDHIIVFSYQWKVDAKTNKPLFSRVSFSLITQNTTFSKRVHITVIV